MPRNICLISNVPRNTCLVTTSSVGRTVVLVGMPTAIVDFHNKFASGESLDTATETLNRFVSPVEVGRQWRHGQTTISTGIVRAKIDFSIPEILGQKCAGVVFFWTETLVNCRYIIWRQRWWAFKHTCVLSCTHLQRNRHDLT